MKDIELRDYFAGCALTGLIVECPATSTRRLVEMSYEVADEMLKIKEETGEKNNG